MTCQCGETATSTDFDPDRGGKIIRCLRCQAELSSGQAASADAQPEPVFKLTAPEPEAPQKRRQQKSAQPAQRPTDIVKLARARLRDVKKELKRLARLEKERGQLERLISAADGKPVAVVRELKRSG